MQRQILLVDNNEVFLKLLTHLLTKKGYHVRTAPDGVSALEVLKDYSPQIIFTDLVMPNIDGQTLCRLIRKNKSLDRVTIVVLSAIALEDESDFRAFGADACIAKGPITDIEKYIDLVLDHVEYETVTELPDSVLGHEHLFNRTVTKELLEYKQDLETILHHIDNGFLELASGGKIIKCNKAALTIFGKEESELLGTNILSHFDREALVPLSSSIEQFNVSHQSVELGHAITLAGREVMVKLVNIPTKGGEGSFVFFQDVTAEKKAVSDLKLHMETLEKVVEERTEKYREVNELLQEKIMERSRINEELEFVARQWNKTFDTITDFVSVHDKDMRLVRVNKALAEHLGMDPEELMGTHCYEVMHGRDTPWPDCPHVKTLQSGEPVTIEVNDPYIGTPLLVTCAPFLHDDGSLMGSVHVARDISQQKKAAEEREALIKKLEESLSKVKLLSGFLPICASCKKIRDDKGYWNQVEEYVANHSEAVFSHGICPECCRKLYPELCRDIGEDDQ